MHFYFLIYFSIAVVFSCKRNNFDSYSKEESKYLTESGDILEKDIKEIETGFIDLQKKIETHQANSQVKEKSEEQETKYRNDADTLTKNYLEMYAKFKTIEHKKTLKWLIIVNDLLKKKVPLKFIITDRNFKNPINETKVNEYIDNTVRINNKLSEVLANEKLHNNHSFFKSSLEKNAKKNYKDIVLKEFYKQTIITCLQEIAKRDKEECYAGDLNGLTNIDAKEVTQLLNDINDDSDENEQKVIDALKDSIQKIKFWLGIK